MPEDQNTTVGQPQVGSDDLLADLFRASAELRFHIKSLNLPRVEQNPSWHRHTAIMRKVEMHLSANAQALAQPGRNKTPKP